MKHAIIGHDLTREELLAMKAANECLVEDDIAIFWWPFCIIDGCTNRAAMRLNSPRCYPHTLPGVPIVEDEDELEELPVTVKSNDVPQS